MPGPVITSSCLQSHSWCPSCDRSFILTDVNVVFFVWISIPYSHPTCLLSFILNFFKMCLCTHIGLIINLNWLHFFSLPTCICYYLFFYFSFFNPAAATLYCHFLGLESILFLPSAIDPTKCFCCSSNFVTWYKWTA